LFFWRGAASPLSTEILCKKNIYAFLNKYSKIIAKICVTYTVIKELAGFLL
jgi:hypothetical protein